MLVGVGGSGKKSITTVASAIQNCKVMSLESKKNYGRSQFKDDLYKMMKNVAFENKKVTFLLLDTQIYQESFIEDVNNLLNSGEIPNLLSKDDLEEITKEL